ncbi:MAG TPA: serine/threonine-protein phosphatase [Candidatus Caccomorpha excrementavium]|nr:serine/threonine-protein phosphatase [Candidatus Caccomorpha excrementavium]
MKYIIAAAANTGPDKDQNQDSILLKRIENPSAEMVFGVLCDGMGGLSEGELASSTLVEAALQWIESREDILCADVADGSWLRDEWTKLLCVHNQYLLQYGRERGIRLGTTVVLMLIAYGQYYVMNVGDSRAYEICGSIRRLTRDHSLVERQVELGILDRREARTDSRRNILTQCIGACDQIYPDYAQGKVRPGAAYLLCSDGFYHKVEEEELYRMTRRELADEGRLNEHLWSVIQTLRARGEFDDCSVGVIRTLSQGGSITKKGGRPGYGRKASGIRYL